jgi:hypothetical protein
MKEIKLTQGKVALVDDEDFEYLNRFKWQAAKKRHTFYAVRTVNRISIRMHRVIMNYPLGFEVDHKNGNGLNNTRNNLRICSRRQNSFNVPCRSISGFKGVGKDKNGYQSAITVNGKRIYLGWYFDPIEAAKKYDLAALKYFGKFAYLNFPQSFPQRQQANAPDSPRTYDASEHRPFVSIGGQLGSCPNQRS